MNTSPTPLRAALAALLLAAAPALQGQTPPAPPATPAAPETPAPAPRAPSWTGSWSFSSDDEDDENRISNTWIGVESSPVPRAFARQLGLPKGMGLVVDRAVPDAPAALAGIQKDDLLKKFDDQWIVNSSQFSVLIQNRNPGDKIRLTILRDGAEKVVEVTLAERPSRRQGEAGHPDGEGGPDGEGFPRALVARAVAMGLDGARHGLAFVGDEAGEEIRVALEGAGGEIEVALESALDEAGEEMDAAFAEGFRDFGRSFADAWRHGHLNRDTVATQAARLARTAAELEALQARLDGLRAGGVPAEAVEQVRQAADQLRRTVTRLDRVNQIYRDDHMSLELSRDGEQTHLVAKDAAGKVLFEGDVSTDEARKALPPEVAERLAKLQSVNVARFNPPAAPDAPEAPRMRVVVDERESGGLSN